MKHLPVKINFYTNDFQNYISNLSNNSYYNKKHKTVHIDIALQSGFVVNPVNPENPYGLSVEWVGIIGTILSKKYIPSNSQLISIFYYGSGDSQNVTQNILKVDKNGNISVVENNTSVSSIIGIGNNSRYHIYGSFRLK